MGQSIIQLLSDIEKNILFSSVKTVQDNMYDFVNRFYTYLLQTNAGELFFATDLEKQKQKFGSSLRILLANLQYPTNLNDFINILITQHSHSQIVSIQIDSFLDSFIKSLKDILKLEPNDRIIKVWTKFMTELMNIFKKQLT